MEEVNSVGERERVLVKERDSVGERESVGHLWKRWTVLVKEHMLCASCFERASCVFCASC